MTPGKHVSMVDAATALGVPVRRLCELVAQGILGAYVVPASGTVVIDRADVAQLSWPPIGGPV